MQLEPVSPLIFQDQLVPKSTLLAGFSALVHAFNAQAPIRTPYCVSESYIRGTIRHEGAWKIYDKRYRPEETLAGHLGFALRHEPLDLLALKRIFDALPEKEMKAFVQEAPTGSYNRRAWFLYEFLTGKYLDLPNAAGNVPAVDVLDSKLYFTRNSILSKRHRVRNNLIGTGQFCPIIRRTETLQTFASMSLSQKAREIVGQVSNQLVARAASFMLLADSRASFEIEGERPPRDRLEHWIKAVKQAGKYPLTVDEISRLHSILIADNRFIRLGLREQGVFLGERDHFRDPLPEFIGAKPEDLPSLMTGLLEANQQMNASEVDPVLQAAATAFGFVYIHPLEDGNGRLHRSLIHHVLAEKQFTPPGLVFPVSSVMLERIQEYQDTLRGHSAPLMAFIEWRSTQDGNVEVTNDTADLYRYYDCTEEAEFLYRCVQRTVEQDLPNEIEYLKRHDEAMRRIMDSIDMSNRLAEDFILFTRQNHGQLPKSRRKKEFNALTDQEVSELEAIIHEVFEGFPDPVAG
jgi:Fic family protein